MMQRRLQKNHPFKEKSLFFSVLFENMQEKLRKIAKINENLLDKPT